MSTDRIERSIEINASAEKVWELIAEPGWFINEGEIREHRIDYQGDLAIVHDSKWGTYAIRTLANEPPRYIAFQWLRGDASDPATQEVGTTVEFWIDERVDGGVVLRVAESGFANLSPDAEEVRKEFEGNTEGWEIELAAAKKRLEA